MAANETPAGMKISWNPNKGQPIAYRPDGAEYCIGTGHTGTYERGGKDGLWDAYFLPGRCADVDAGRAGAAGEQRKSGVPRVRGAQQGQPLARARRVPPPRASRRGLSRILPRKRAQNVLTACSIARLFGAKNALNSAYAPGYVEPPVRIELF